jgi:U3 small nucleolar RNA-associated protein 14
MVQRLPSAVDSELDYSRDIRTPVGKEWTPTIAHAALTAPRIITRAGLAIDPISLTPEQERKYKEKAEKYVAKYHKK